jgi:hypothetical protein
LLACYTTGFEPANHSLLFNLLAFPQQPQGYLLWAYHLIALLSCCFLVLAVGRCFLARCDTTNQPHHGASNIQVIHIETLLVICHPISINCLRIVDEVCCCLATLSLSLSLSRDTDY